MLIIIEVLTLGLPVEPQLVRRLEARTDSEGASAAPKGRREIVVFVHIDLDLRVKALAVPEGVLTIGLGEIDALLGDADAVRFSADELRPFHRRA